MKSPDLIQHDCMKKVSRFLYKSQIRAICLKNKIFILLGRCVTTDFDVYIPMEAQSTSINRVHMENSHGFFNDFVQYSLGSHKG